MNKIVIIGNLTRDPESGVTHDGVNFAHFTVAVNRPFTNAAGERLADYFDVVAWRVLGERCAKYLYKGSKVGVSGRVQRKLYEDRDGIKRTSFTVVADEVEFLTPKKATTVSSDAPDEPLESVSELQPVDGDDLPF